MARMSESGSWRGRDDGLHIGVRGRGSAADADLGTLVSRLSTDATQLVHDELELAKLELRDVTQTLSADLKEAGQTLAKDLAKLGVSLVLAMLAGLALTAGAIMGIGLLVGAYWAGALIVGVLLAIGAAIFARSAATDLQDSDALRLDSTRRAARSSTAVVRDEMQQNREFARREAAEFKDRATGQPRGGPSN
jgi:hypothetical protein